MVFFKLSNYLFIKNIITENNTEKRGINLKNAKRFARKLYKD